MVFQNPLFRFLFGILLIALLDTIGAIATNKLNFSYIRLALLSLAIYIFAGFILAKVSSYPTTAIYSVLLGLFDGTIGLELSIYFGANLGLDEDKINKMKGFQTGFMMMLVGLLFGSIGFALA